MKFYRLTFFASLFLTAVMLMLVYVFDAANHSFSETDQQFLQTLILSTLILIIINYLVVDFLFNFYGKRQIRKISTILPEEIRDEESNLNFKELSQKFTDLNLKNATEIDTMKGMETYRKEYIGNISHELKTPLFTIQGYVDTLLEGGVENLAIRDKYLERIDKSVERLLNIVKDLDMINQFESGEITGVLYFVSNCAVVSTTEFWKGPTTASIFSKLFFEMIEATLEEYLVLSTS